MPGTQYRHVYSTNKGNAVRQPTMESNVFRTAHFNAMVAMNPYEEAARLAKMGGYGGGDIAHQATINNSGMNESLSPANGGAKDRADVNGNIRYSYGNHNMATMFNSPQTMSNCDFHHSGNMHRCVYSGLNNTRLQRANEYGTRLNSSLATPTKCIPTNDQGTASVTLTSTFPPNQHVSLENGQNYARSISTLPYQPDTCMYNSAIPTANYIHSLENLSISSPKAMSDLSSASQMHSNTDMQQAECENEYPHLALDLTKVRNQFGQPTAPTKHKPRERNTCMQTKEGSRANRVSSGKPLHPYTAMFNDPVEKELERWHNIHNSTIKWQRVKRGVYTADGQEVLLVKLNGCLYVKGSNPNNKLDHTPIDNFVQSMQAASHG